MTDKEQNSAEKAAEEILKDAYAEAQAEECPQGDQCPVHFRVDSEYISEDEKYARLITYTGDYCVITEDNPRLSNPLTMLKAVLGLSAMLPRWETAIFYVGQGPVGDLTSQAPEKIQAACRYASQHDVWEEVLGVHNTTVFLLESGMIDVSKAVG